MSLRLLLLAPLALSAPAIAQQGPVPSSLTEAAPADAASISDDAGRDLGGRAAINLAAGSGNAQANLAAIALSAGGLGMTTLQIQQDLPMSPEQVAELRQRDASARIGGHAFAGSAGLLSINQVAGGGNAQLNVFALGNAGAAIAASGPTGLDDAALAAVAGSNPTEGAEAPRGLRQVEIADGAFHGSQGVVQVNQTAGVGNVSANAIVLQLPGGTP